jgi:hypothetical protein
MNKIACALIFLTATTMISCGGGGDPAASPESRSLSGSWEFVAQSASDGSTTLIESNLNSSGTAISASGPNQVQTATYQNSAWWIDGSCPSQSPGQNSVSGSMTEDSVTVTFNEGGNIFTGSGSMNSGSIAGTWSGGGRHCPDSGTFTATAVPKLSGTYAGMLAFSGGADTVRVSLTEQSDYSLKVEAELSGTDNGTFQLTGTAVANVLFVKGNLAGSPVSVFGYYDAQGRYTGVRNSIAVFDYTNLGYEGLLTQQ